MTGSSSMDGKELLRKIGEIDGYELFRYLLSEVMQVVLEAERDEHVGVGRYKQSEERNDMRSGYKPRSIDTMVGRLALRKPQTRDGMKSEVLERYSRIDQSVLTMAAEMYVQGVSTRRVESLLKETIGISVSASTVSRANKRLDEGIQALRERELGSMPVLYVDARFDKVRRDGSVRNTATLLVIGIDRCGNRRIIDLCVVESETKESWKSFFQRLKDRGLRDVLFVVSDDHQGLRAALSELFIGAVWQRCQTHIARNILDRTPRAWKQEMGLRIRDVFSAPDEESARSRLRDLLVFGNTVKKQLGDYLEELMLDGFAVFSLPGKLRRRLRTTNMVERINQEMKRRTKVARIFPSVESYERCVGSVLVHIDEKWQESSYRYLDVALLLEILEINDRTDRGGGEIIHQVA